MWGNTDCENAGCRTTGYISRFWTSRNAQIRCSLLPKMQFKHLNLCAGLKDPENPLQ